MKKVLLFIFFTLLQLSLYAQNINGRFSSSLYSFERFDSSDVSDTYVRSYQLLNLNINRDKFSLRSYLNLESDLTKKLDSDPRLRFYNLYLEGRNLFNIATIKIGRQPLFNSVAGGVFDGADVDLKYDMFSLSGFYGGNVPAYQKLELTDQWKDDYIFGGKFTVDPITDLRIALSFINKNFRPYKYLAARLDENLNPISILIENNSNQYKFGIAEASYFMKDLFSVEARFDYDFNYDIASKVEFNGRYEQVKNLGVELYYNYREPRIRYNSIFSVFDFGTSQEIEAGVDYDFGLFTVIGKFADVEFKDENSQRLSVGMNTDFGSILYRKNFGYAGELDAISIYGAHSLWEGLLTPSIGLSYSSYKLSDNDTKNNLASVLAGFNVRPWRILSFDLQGQYMNNRIYKNDFRFLFKLNYWFNTNLNLI